MNLIRATWRYLRARRRMIGRCPPHRWSAPAPDGFCLDCGIYRPKA